MSEEAYIDTSVPTYRTTRAHVPEACRLRFSLPREPRISHASRLRERLRTRSGR